MVNKKCIYCNINEATEKDHVPPQGFFDKPLPSNLITVPACHDCNTKISFDEGYVRNLLLMLLRNERNKDIILSLCDKKLIPSMKKTEKYEKLLIREVIYRDIFTQNNIYVGKLPTFKQDNSRIENVIKKTAVGLHYYETGYSLTINCIARIFMNPEPNEFPEKVVEIIASKKEKIIHDDIFRYRCAFMEDKNAGSLWLMEFYKGPFFLVILKNNERK